MWIISKSHREKFFLHIFAIPSSSRHEKLCVILQIFFVYFKALETHSEMVQSVNILPVIWFHGFQRLWQEFPISEFFWEKLIDWLCIWLHPVNGDATYNKKNFNFRVGIMVILIVKFSRMGVTKLEIFLPLKINILKGNVWILRICVMVEVSKSAKIWLSKLIFYVKMINF